MGILWLIIKIILLVIASVLGLVILSLFIILLSPIYYEIYFEKYEQIQYDIKGKYLGGIKFYCGQDRKQQLQRFTLFGKKLYEKKVDLEVVAEEKVDTSQMNQEAQTNHRDSKSVETYEPKRGKHKTVNNKQEVTQIKKEVEPEVTEDEKNPMIREAEEKADDALYKAEEEVKDTVQHLDWQQAKALFLSEAFLNVLKQLIRAGGRMIKKIAPKEWSFDVVIGAEDSASTGELLAKLSLLYPWYAGHGNVRADFEEPRLEGGFLAEGHFTLMSLLIILIRLLIHKDTRQYIGLVMRIRKEEKNGE